jgi:hypothetical protein
MNRRAGSSPEITRVHIGRNASLGFSVHERIEPMGLTAYGDEAPIVISGMAKKAAKPAPLAVT